MNERSVPSGPARPRGRVVELLQRIERALLRRQGPPPPPKGTVRLREERSPERDLPESNFPGKNPPPGRSLPPNPPKED